MARKNWNYTNIRKWSQFLNDLPPYLWKYQTHSWYWVIKYKRKLAFGSTNEKLNLTVSIDCLKWECHLMSLCHEKDSIFIQNGAFLSENFPYWPYFLYKKTELHTDILRDHGLFWRCLIYSRFTWIMADSFVPFGMVGPLFGIGLFSGMDRTLLKSV